MGFHGSAVILISTGRVRPALDVADQREQPLSLEGQVKLGECCSLRREREALPFRLVTVECDERSSVRQGAANARSGFYQLVAVHNYNQRPRAVQGIERIRNICRHHYVMPRADQRL